ncbi:MAG: hypothetical protein M1280_06010 [Actinobacteria bacterium]|jgi:CBS-domain-containing membrane protein|nr:hypothetical protein [Actinomycetota bacterium]
MEGWYAGNCNAGCRDRVIGLEVREVGLETVRRKQHKIKIEQIMSREVAGITDV